MSAPPTRPSAEAAAWSAAARERRRVQRHLRRAERSARRAPVTALDPMPRLVRALLLDELATYRARGRFPRSLDAPGRTSVLLMPSWRPVALLLVSMFAVGCSEPFELPPDGNPCAAGSEPVYGWPFDDAHRCVDFAATERRVAMGCLPIENRVMGGAITCYARTDGSQRVMTPWYYYSALESQGWTACGKGEAAALHPNCR